VSAAGGIAGLPMTSSDYAGNTPYAVEAFGQAAAAARPQVTYRVVTPGYFEAVRTAVVAGRAPTNADRAADGAPVLVSANLAARLFPGQSAVGQRIRRVRRVRPEAGEGWTTIVGVVADVRADGVTRPSPEIVYLPMLDAAAEDGFGAGYLGYVMRTSVPPLSLVPAVRAAVHELDAELPIAQVRTMRDIVAAASARTAFITLLLAAAAAAALFLGMIGIYGVLSYAMSQRRREIGLRMALGARSGQVTRMVLRDGLTLTAGGLLAGTAAAALLTRFLQSLLFEVRPDDPSTFLGTAALLLGVALLACAVPALRAAAVQPMEALADE
jgi:predicted permease